MEVRDSALKHGLERADVLHAWHHVIRTVEQDYDGEVRLLAIGPARDGALGGAGRRPGRRAAADHPR